MFLHGSGAQLHPLGRAMVTVGDHNRDMQNLRDLVGGIDVAVRDLNQRFGIITGTIASNDIQESS